MVVEDLRHNKPNIIEVIHRDPYGEVLKYIKQHNAKYNNESNGTLLSGMIADYNGTTYKAGMTGAPINLVPIIDPNYTPAAGDSLVLGGALPFDEICNQYNGASIHGLSRKNATFSNFVAGTPASIKGSATWTYTPTNTATKTNIYGVATCGPYMPINFNIQHGSYSTTQTYTNNSIPPYVAQPADGLSSRCGVTGTGITVSVIQQSTVTTPSLSGQPAAGTGTYLSVVPYCYKVAASGSATNWTLSPQFSSTANYVGGIIPGQTYTAVAYIACDAALTAPTAHIDINWYNSAGSVLTTSTGSAQSISTTNRNFAPVYVHGTAPANAFFASVTIGNSSTTFQLGTGANSNNAYINYIQFAEDSSSALTTYTSDPYRSFNFYYSMFGSGNQIGIANGDSLTVNWTWSL